MALDPHRGNGWKRCWKVKAVVWRCLEIGCCLIYDDICLYLVVWMLFGWLLASWIRLQDVHFCGLQLKTMEKACQALQILTPNFFQLLISVPLTNPSNAYNNPLPRLHRPAENTALVAGASFAMATDPIVWSAATFQAGNNWSIWHVGYDVYISYIYVITLFYIMYNYYTVYIIIHLYIYIHIENNSYELKDVYTIYSYVAHISQYFTYIYIYCRYTYTCLCIIYVLIRFYEYLCVLIILIHIQYMVLQALYILYDTFIT